jgi:hypothetical protein
LHRSSWIDGTHRLAIAVLVSLGLASIGVAIWSLAHGGIGWDSREHTQAALAVRSVDSSWPLAKAYASVPGPLEFYGVLIQQLADLLHGLVSGSSSELGVDDPATYAYQGAVNLFLSVVAVTTLAVALGVALRSMLAATFSWALILSTPLWLGTSHVNFKDMPLAAGLTLVTAGLILSVSLRPPRRATGAGILAAGAGGALMLATRPGSIVLLTALALGTAVIVFVIGLRARMTTLPVQITALSAIGIGLLFVWVTNPIARIALFPWIRDSVHTSRSFPWEGSILTAGQDLWSTHLPWWYVPAWLGAQLPLLTLLAIAAGVVTLILIAVRSPAGEGKRFLALVPILLQALVLPVMIVGSGAVIYDGIRHVLFLVPALLAVPAVALAMLDRRPGMKPRVRSLLAGGAVIVVAASLFASIRWAPYSYAFINPVAGHNGDSRSWELDYWGVTGREGVTRLEKLGLSPVYVSPTPRVGVAWGANRGAGIPSGGTGGLYIFLRDHLPTNYGCTVLFTIKRDGHTLGKGERCTAATAPVP